MATEFGNLLTWSCGLLHPQERSAAEVAGLESRLAALAHNKIQLQLRCKELLASIEEERGWGSWAPPDHMPGHSSTAYMPMSCRQHMYFPRPAFTGPPMPAPITSPHHIQHHSS
jgi:hypothetical protein